MPLEVRTGGAHFGAACDPLELADQERRKARVVGLELSEGGLALARDGVLRQFRHLGGSQPATEALPGKAALLQAGVTQRDGGDVVHGIVFGLFCFPSMPLSFCIPEMSCCI